MCRAVIVSVFGDHPPLTTDEIKAAMVVRFGLVFISNEDTATRVVNAGQSTGSGGPRLNL